MDISVIIVNYNVKDFLVQCLNSVHIALQGIDSEIIIIDNNSTDGSKEYFSDKYSDAHLSGFLIILVLGQQIILVYNNQKGNIYFY